MARFSFDEADNYGQSGSGSFFSLKDDGDSAKVRFLYNTIDDLQGYIVHQVEVDGKTRYVNCLRTYNEPIEKCPFCAAQMKPVPRLFIKVWNEDAGEPQIWERGKTYFQRLAGLASHYNPLCNEVVEIQRHGKAGDKNTSYEFYPIGNSDMNLEEALEQCADPLGTIILDKTEAEMNQFLDYGQFPEAANDVAKQRSNNNAPFNGGVVRRTPSNQQPGRRAF